MRLSRGRVGRRAAAAAFGICVLLPGARGQERLLERAGALDDSAFGDSVAGVGDLDGDQVGDLIVGAPFHDPFGLFAGRALILSGATRFVIHDLLGPTFSLFGDAVAGGDDIDADGVADLLVAAPLLSSNGPHAGRVYLYSGASGSFVRWWNGEQMLSFLGDSVGFAGDLDGDGTSDVLAGSAAFSGSAGSGCGKLYAWTPASGGELWSFEGPGAGDALGLALARLSDVDGDSVPDVAVAAPLHDGVNGSDAGAVFVLSGASGALIKRIEGEAASDEFGAALAPAGDCDGDGMPELLVGAPGYGTGAGTRSGRVYRIDAATGAVLQTFDGDQAGGELGRAVAAIGDSNGDATADFAAGAPFGADGRGAATGNALLFDASNRLLHRWVGREAGDRLGASLTGVGDWNGDQRSEVVVAAPDADGGGSKRGELLVDGGTRLFLGSDLLDAAAAETVTLTTRGGTQGRLGLLVVVDISDTPLFVPLVLTAFDAVGAIELADAVPPGLAGLVISLRSFGQGPVHGIVTSGVTHLDLL